jgi:hypothetical protein
MTREDIADALIPPNVEIDAATVLAMVDRISKHPDILSRSASDFLSQVVYRLKGRDAADLSPRQAQWLYALDKNAAAEAERIQPEQRPTLRVVAANGNEDESTLH